VDPRLERPLHERVAQRRGAGFALAGQAHDPPAAADLTGAPGQLVRLPAPRGTDGLARLAPRPGGGQTEVGHEPAVVAGQMGHDATHVVVAAIGAEPVDRHELAEQTIQLGHLRGVRVHQLPQRPGAPHRARPQQVGVPVHRALRCVPYRHAA
jgi:hypothetical protein